MKKNTKKNEKNPTPFESMQVALHDLLYKPKSILDSSLIARPIIKLDENSNSTQ